MSRLGMRRGVLEPTDVMDKRPDLGRREDLVEAGHTEAGDSDGEGAVEVRVSRTGAHPSTEEVGRQHWSEGSMHRCWFVKWGQ